MKTYSVARVIAKRNAIMNALSLQKYRVGNEPLEAYIGEEKSVALPLILPVFVDYLGIHPRIAEQTAQALLASCEYPTWANYRDMAWIMAANIPVLKTKPIEQFTAVEFDEWVPVTVVDHKVAKLRNQDGNCYTFLCMGGSPCTRTFDKTFTYAQFNWMRCILFKLPRNTWRSVYGRRLVGMRTWVLIEAGRSLSFNRGECVGTFVQYNCKLLKSRGTPCPAGNQLPCDECPVGLDNCDRSTHSATYVHKLCGICANPHAQFLATDRSGEERCLKCREHSRKHL